MGKCFRIMPVMVGGMAVSGKCPGVIDLSISDAITGRVTELMTGLISIRGDSSIWYDLTVQLLMEYLEKDDVKNYVNRDLPGTRRITSRDLLPLPLPKWSVEDKSASGGT